MPFKDTFEGGIIPVDTATLRNVPVPPVEEVELVVTSRLGANEASVETVQAIVAQAMAARDAEVSALRTELQQIKVGAGQKTDATGAGGFPWMYWRKPQTWPDKASRGWVGVAPGGPTPAGSRDTGSYNLYLRKGMIPITKYGYIDPPTSPEAVHSLLPMLRKGGAVEFPASQVIAFKWHLTPPIEGMKFPQYELVKGTVINFVCEACGHTMYFLADQKHIAGENYRAHLIVAHKYPFRESAEAIRLAGFLPRPFSAETQAAEETMTVAEAAAAAIKA